MHADFSSNRPAEEISKNNKHWQLKISRAIHGERRRTLQPRTVDNKNHYRGILESSGRLNQPMSDHDPLLDKEWTNDKYVKKQNKALLSVLLITSEPEKTNARKPLFKIIRDLGRNEAIHIIQADKGSATVILNTVDYDKESSRQLEDKKTYSELTRSEFDAGLRATAQMVRETADELLRAGNLTRNEYDVFITKLEKLDGSYIYFLPKIHKEWNEQTNSFPGRPIAATFGCVVNTLDKYITELTKPLLPIVPGSLLDTPDMLIKLPTGPLPKNSKFVMSDVNSLYPAIPWAGGIEAATAFYADNIQFLREHHRRQGLLPPPSIQVFCDAITTVITQSFISYKGRRFFKQASGTSMGSCISVYLANAYMFQITKHLIPHKGFTATRRPSWLIFFERFIDDLVLIVDECNQQQIDDLFTGISNETISYTTTKPASTAPALDVQLSICQETFQIVTEPYSKPTSKQTFLHAKSTHPPHSINSLPYAQYIRLRRIASTEEAFKRHADKLTNSLILRDYPIQVIRKALAKANLKTREDLLYKARNRSNRPDNSHPNANTISIASSFKYITKYRDDVQWSKAKQLLKLAHAAAARHYANRTPSLSPSDPLHKNSIARDLLTRKTSAVVFAVHNNTRAMLTRNYKKSKNFKSTTKQPTRPIKNTQTLLTKQENQLPFSFSPFNLWPCNKTEQKFGIH